MAEHLARRCPECGHQVKGDKPSRLCRQCENNLRVMCKMLLGTGLGYFLKAG